MIALDTSALMAVLLDETPAQACRDAMWTNRSRVISAATLAEALIVAGRRSLAADMADLIAYLRPTVLPVDTDGARLAADAYARWGKGVHAARLNLMDCFSYAVARANGCPLLYVGDDFAQTDVVSALAPRLP